MEVVAPAPLEDVPNFSVLSDCDGSDPDTLRFGGVIFLSNRRRFKGGLEVAGVSSGLERFEGRIS